MFITIKSFWPGIIALVVVTVLLVLPGKEFPQESWFEKIYLDKLVHIFLFFVLVQLFYQPVSPAPAKLFAIACIAICYGVAMEFIQGYWIPDRSFELADIFSDAAGAIAALLIGSIGRKK